MARQRMIKPEFFRHADLYDAEVAAGLPLRLAFAGLWTVADRAGRFKWRPREIKLDVLPHDPVDFAQVLAALEVGGFIASYVVDGQRFGYIPSFLAHQRPHVNEQASELPEPPDGGTSTDASTAREVPEHHHGSAEAQPNTPVSNSNTESESESKSESGAETVSRAPRAVPPKGARAVRSPRMPPAGETIEAPPPPPVGAAPALPAPGRHYPWVPETTVERLHAVWRAKVGAISMALLRTQLGEAGIFPAGGPPTYSDAELEAALGLYVTVTKHWAARGRAFEWEHAAPDRWLRKIAYWVTEARRLEENPMHIDTLCPRRDAA